MRDIGLVQIAKEVYVVPNDVVSVERQIINSYVGGSPSDSCYEKTFDGSRLILKNGRKVYVNGVMPDGILEILKFGILESDPTKPESVPGDKAYS